MVMASLWLVAVVAQLYLAALACASSSSSLHEHQQHSSRRHRHLIVDADADAQPTEFPYYVRSANPLAGLCGGALVHPDVFVTAAHCHGAFRYGVHVGYYNNSSDDDKVMKRKAVTYKRHLEHDRNPKIIAADILVVQLDKPVYNLTTIKLNNNPALPADLQKVTFVGTGKTEQAGQPTEQLQKADLYVVPQQACADALGLGSNVAIRSDILCAGFPVDLQAPCKGDSGGPLILQSDATQDSSPTDDLLVGVVSFGKLCGTINPNGFARISTFYDWIQQQVCLISADPPANCPAILEDNPTTQPAAAVPTSSGMYVTITVMYGDNPEETTYNLRNAQTFDVIHAGPEYNPEIPFSPYHSRPIALPPGEYWLEFHDTKKNGLSGFLRNGYYEVTGTYIHGPEQQEPVVLVARRDETFTDYDRAVFNVTAAATAAGNGGDATKNETVTTTPPQDDSVSNGDKEPTSGDDQDDQQDKDDVNDEGDPSSLAVMVAEPTRRTLLLLGTTIVLLACC